MLENFNTIIEQVYLESPYHCPDRLKVFTQHVSSKLKNISADSTPSTIPPNTSFLPKETLQDSEAMGQVPELLLLTSSCFLYYSAAALDQVPGQDF